jgi:isopentenyl diphosphate isomerase/L-lactate dehydrogenase-like FMN-dependent dehydrogenase
LPRREDLINVPEFEEVAKLTLDNTMYSTIAGGDRAAFDRMTFRPRMMVPTLDLDMSVELLGETHFTPIMAGPVAEQRRYHADGELATVRGASAARAVLIVSSRSSVPIGEIAAQARTPLWFSVYAEGADDNVRRQIDQAVVAGCKAICATVGASGKPSPRPTRTGIDWKAIEAIRRGLAVPLVVKGVLTTQDATRAIDAGAGAIVVSDHGIASGTAAPIDTLGAVVDACAGKAAVLVDGSFRRGSDIAKALALGARAVLLARPVMWGLAAYGAGGVQMVIELLQSELGRTMGALGAPNLKSLTRSMVKVHRR